MMVSLKCQRHIVQNRSWKFSCDIYFTLICLIRPFKFLIMEFLSELYSETFVKYCIDIQEFSDTQNYQISSNYISVLRSFAHYQKQSNHFRHRNNHTRNLDQLILYRRHFLSLRSIVQLLS